MKGIVFNLLEAVVRRDYGEDTWEALLEAAAADGAYSSLGNYPDAEMMNLVGAASSALKIPADDVVRSTNIRRRRFSSARRCNTSPSSRSR